MDACFPVCRHGKQASGKMCKTKFHIPFLCRIKFGSGLPLDYISIFLVTMASKIYCQVGFLLT